MTLISYRVENIAFLGKRTVPRCAHCRIDLGHFARADDARAEATLHLARYHQTPGAA